MDVKFNSHFVFQNLIWMTYVDSEVLPLLVMNSNEPINMRTKTNRGLNQIKSLRFVVFVE